MHRVELKDLQLRNCLAISDNIVPNAPCGVERLNAIFNQTVVVVAFLMHRVELKG